MPQLSLSTRLQDRAKLVTAAICGRALPGRDTAQMLAVLDEMPKARSRLWMGAVLGVVFALALVAAQFGVWGLGIYFAVFVLLFR